MLNSYDSRQVDATTCKLQQIIKQLSLVIVDTITNHHDGVSHIGLTITNHQ